MNEELTTREKIVHESLDLFSNKGFDGVSMRDISKAVGIKAASIYSHFTGKEDIFNVILEEMDLRYKAEAGNMDIDGRDASRDVNLFARINANMLKDMVLKMFDYFVHDEFTSKCRKMLTIEQFKSPELAKLYNAQYTQRPIQYLTALFSSLIEKYTLEGEDPEIMAVHFYSTIYYYMTVCDRNPELEPMAKDMVGRHALEFVNKYKSKKK